MSLQSAMRDRLTCPECHAPFGPAALEDRRGNVAICHGCAALSVKDGHRYRPLRTQEWCDLVLDPRFYDVLEGRQAVLERLTAPPMGLTHEANGTYK